MIDKAKIRQIIQAYDDTIPEKQLHGKVKTISSQIEALAYDLIRSNLSIPKWFPSA